jgi:hypothetical protein
LAEIESAVRNELSGEWDIALQPAEISGEFHQHHSEGGVTEFHRAHPTRRAKDYLETDPVSGMAESACSAGGHS